MPFSNRLILTEEQEPVTRLAGEKIGTSRTAGSFGFSYAAAEADVVELRHTLDTGSEPVYITMPLFRKLQAAFLRLGRHRARVEKAERAKRQRMPGEGQPAPELDELAAE